MLRVTRDTSAMSRVPSHILALGLVLAALPAKADRVGLTPEELRRVIEAGGRTLVIERNQDSGATVPPEFARIARACPPWCIVPLAAAPGVRNLAELEVIDFLTAQVATGAGLLVDARLPESFHQGTIPGAINLPFNALDPANPYRDAIIEALGASRGGAGWDFSAAQELAVFCGGPWCDQAARAIRHLLAVGYPAERLRFYRGGVQDWVMLGLNTALPPVGN